MPLFKNIPQRIVIRQHRRTGAEEGIRLNRQLIPRQVRRVELDGLAQIVQRFIQRLVRQAVHQVEVEAAQTEAGGQMRRAFRLGRAVNTSQTLQLCLAKALHADGDPVDPRALILDKAIGLHGAGVGLHGDLGICCQRQAGANAVEQGPHRRPGEQARRTAADKNSPDFTALGVVRVGPQIVEQVLHVVVVRYLALQRVRVKIAVRALLHAPRDVNIQAQRWQISHYVMLPVTVSARARGGISRFFLHDSAPPRFYPQTEQRK